MRGDVILNTTGQTKFSQNGNYLLKYGDGAEITDLDGVVLSTFSGHTNINDADFSPNGTYVVTGSEDGSVKVWEAATGTEVNTINYANPVKAVAFGEHLVISTTQTYIVEYDTSVEIASFAGGFDHIAIDGEIVLGGSSIEIRDGQGNLINSFSASAVGMDVKNKKIATCDTNILIRDFSGNVLNTLSGHTGTINSVAFSPDGNFLVTAGDDGIVKVWDDSTNIYDFTDHAAAVTDVSFSPNGDLIASTSTDTKLWKLIDTVGKMYFTAGGVVYDDEITYTLDLGDLQQNDEIVKKISFINETGSIQDTTISTPDTETTFSKSDSFPGSDSLSYTGIDDGVETEFFIKVAPTELGEKQLTLNLS